MEKKEFKAESKRLLDLMINSIYTHKEIFLRELISNASDALDRRHFRALTDDSIPMDRDSLTVSITLDKQGRSLTIADTGIGMTRDELEGNLGVIARSGSLQFIEQNKELDGVDIIGRFGVGFYSAFMVASQVSVKSRSLDDAQGYLWSSSGADGYTVEPCDIDATGTEITLIIKENTEDEQFDRFLEEYQVRSLIKKYSDFIKYPIRMEVGKSRLKEGSDKEYETYREIETINSMTPLWRKNKQELTGEDYDNFYMDKHFGYQKPLHVVHAAVDGAVSYIALLYIPASAPFDFYTKQFEKGLELYSNGVLIMQKCADLLPDYFAFAQGLVDSADVSLNISREMLQHDRQLQFMAKKIKERINKELLSLRDKEREKYETFFEHFGRSIKYGVYDNYGAHKEELQDLLLYYSSTEKKKVTLDEYVSRMKEGQKYIYYAIGESIAKLDVMPQTERVAGEGYEILYGIDEIDEFALKILQSYKEKEFRSVSHNDLGLSDKDGEKTDQPEEQTALFGAMKEALGDRVKDVRASRRLRTYPVCLSSEGELSLEMEKVLGSMPIPQDHLKADRILEINTEHPVYPVLCQAYDGDRDKLALYTRLLYQQALLNEGFAPEDPVSFGNDVCALMV